MSVTLVLVGCGGIARAAHLPALAMLRDEGRVDLVGVCDADVTLAQRVATEFRIPAASGDLADLLRRTGARAVSLAVPPGPNVALALEALSLGSSVMTEKPPARNAAQAQQLADAASARPDLVTMVGFNRRYAPLYRRARAAANGLGDPHAFHGRFTRASLGQDPSNTAGDWVTSDGSHALDLAVATIGMPTSLAVSRRTVGRGPANVWTIQLQSAAGAAVLQFDFAAGRRIERFEWSGPGYDVALELPDRGEWAAQNRGVEVWTTPARDERERIAVGYGFLDEYRAFLDALSGGARPPTDFAYGARFMRLVEAILETPAGETRRLDLEAPAESEAPRSPVIVASRASSSRPRVLVLQDAAAQRRHFDTAALTAISEKCDLVLHTGEDWRGQFAEAEVVVAGWGAPALDGSDLDRAESLRLFVAIGASLRAFDPERLLARGVLVCNTADAIARSVAEHCLALTLVGLRRLTDVDRQMHAGGWPPVVSGRFSYQSIKQTLRTLPGIEPLKPVLKPLARRIEARSGAGGGSHTAWRDLDGLVVGLIGWGHIARHFARLLAPLGCEILVHSALASDAELNEHGVRRAALGEVLGASHVVSLHRGLTNASRGSIGARELALLRPGTLLINTARSALIDEPALVARLAQGDLIAALDVFDVEPLPRSHPLRRVPNTILTPHSASSTPECRRRAGRQALDIVNAWIDGRPIPAIPASRLTSMT